MASQQTSEHKKSLLKNDGALVCGMLVFYSLCIVGLIGAVLWGLERRYNTFTADSTSTANAVSTQQVKATTTAVARGTELAGYELIDTFDSNRNQWRIGAEEGDYWQGSTKVMSGVYIWDVREVRDGFVAWSESPSNDYIKDYDTYVSTKIDQVPTGADACSGLLYRLSTRGWDDGGYSFVVCRSGRYEIYYHNAEGWEKISSQYVSAVRPFDWNRLEVSVKGSHFIFRINGQVVHETDDDRQARGGVALMIDADVSGTKILFDNFGYQPRNHVSVIATGTVSQTPMATATTRVTDLLPAQGTSTAIARATELAGYQLIDTFDSNANGWVTGSQTGLESDYTSSITSGEYLWQIDETYVDHATVSAEFPAINAYIKNYDAYVDTKFVENATDNTCSGLLFRTSPLRWGGYVYMICHSGHFAIYRDHVTKGCDGIAFQAHDSIRPADWNRLEVLVQDSHFTFLINSQVVYELEDDRQPVGGVALMMQVEKAETKIVFDNFGYRRR